MPVVPKDLIWQKLIEGTSQLPLSVCIERIENMQKRWHYPYVVHVYPLRVDADTAEFVITIKIANGVIGWLFAELHAQTKEITSVQAEAGADSIIKALFAVVGFIGGLVAFIAFIHNLLLGSLISLVFVVGMWNMNKEVYEQLLVGEFKRALLSNNPN